MVITINYNRIDLITWFKCKLSNIKISKSSYIHHSEIGEYSVIGDDASISHSVVGKNVVIGAEVVLVNCVIGDNVIISNNDKFAYLKNFNIQQGDKIEFLPNCCILMNEKTWAWYDIKLNVEELLNNGYASIYADVISYLRKKKAWG